MRPTDEHSEPQQTDFNPRTHVGCDVQNANQGVNPTGISIHAPTWGATHLLFKLFLCLAISIHAPTWGATEAAHLPLAVLQFQSTHPRGVRPRRGWRPAPPSNFNPRTHVGCDLFFLRILQPIRYFNPRTHVGCDFGKWFVKHPWNISIHAPTWGATLLLVLAFPLAGISIHAPTWGATKSHSVTFIYIKISIHAPTWGATQGAHSL